MASGRVDFSSSAQYQAQDPWSARSTPHMLRERERGGEKDDGGGEKWRHADRQTDRHIHIERLLDRQTD